MSNKDNSHPEIPPNCGFFKEHSDGWSFHIGYGMYCLIRHSSDFWRPIIAAIARVAWLDEKERLYSICLEWCKRNDPDGAADIPDDGSWCQKHVDAWKEWGKKSNG